MHSTNRTSTVAMIFLLLSCASFNSSAEVADAKPSFGVFTNPQHVTIVGYDQNAMEPFVSPDGNYLFFNSSNSARPTNLYYATLIDDLTYQFQIKIVGHHVTRDAR